jgi:SH3-like domain-containing protein
VIYSEANPEETPLHLFDSRLRLTSHRRPLRILRLPLLLALAVAVLAPLSCQRSGSGDNSEYVYVSVPETTLRDRVAVVYNQIGTVKNGDRLQVLERQRRFIRVRTAQNLEGWISLRCVASAPVYERFQQLHKENLDTPVQSHGVTRFKLNMHIDPSREGQVLYQLAANTKVELLKRATSPRATREEIASEKAARIARLAQGPITDAPAKEEPAEKIEREGTASEPAASASSPSEKDAPEPMDDWWLARDAEGHTGWVLARMVYADIPLDIAQYAGGERIQAAFLLNTVQDAVKGAKGQYLVLLNEDRDGIPYDFNQVRVFSWNLKRHRYETAYLQRHIVGYFPATVATENFGNEGDMPVFTLRLQNEDGSIGTRKFRIIGNIVRSVETSDVKPPKLARPPAGQK